MLTTLLSSHNIEGYWEAMADFLRINFHPVYPNHKHIEGAVDWLVRAQDVTNNGGVAKSYSLGVNSHIRFKGWAAAYPETTGYIIPTLFDCCYLFRDNGLRERAIRMADWECKIQMKDGAIPGGTINEAPIETVFNTG